MSAIDWTPGPLLRGMMDGGADAYLRGREQEFEREKLRANDAIRKLQDLKARQREMRRRGRR